MDIKINTITLCIVLWSAYFMRSASGQDNCITFHQVQVGALNDETKLVCRVTDNSQRFVIKLDINEGPISFTVVDRQNGIVEQRIPLPEGYECMWIDTQSALVVTVKKEIFGGGGQWKCTFQGESNCEGHVLLDVIVYGTAFQTLILLTCLRFWQCALALGTELTIYMLYRLSICHAW